MKLTKLIAFAGVLLSASAFGAVINFGNITLGGTDIALYDNSGAPLVAGVIDLYSGTAPTDPAAALALTSPLQSVALGPATAPGGGLVSGKFELANLDGSLTGLDLFVVIKNEAGDQVGVIDILGEFGTDTPTQPASSTDNWNYPAQITVQDANSGPGTVDYSAIGAGSAPGYQMRLTPEPSTSLLAALAGLGLLIRRKR